MEKKLKLLKDLMSTNKSERGLTIIEVLVAIVMSTIVLAGLYMGYDMISKQFNNINKRSNIYNTGRNVVSGISRDLRMAGFKDYKETKIDKPLEHKDKNDCCDEISIIYDVDFKGSPQRRKARYYVKDKKIHKIVEKYTNTWETLDQYKNEDQAVIAESVKDLQFFFYDNDGKKSDTYNSSDHYTVEVEVKIIIKDALENNGKEVTDTFSTQAMLRNIFYQDEAGI